ncbi:NADPH-dependent F420 reductase [Variovorax sp. GB1R11]|uniref:NADPH-dependent F420 reductase n=1 Tax=Variovorax sp. GB1R11 TaxID=3443741 RepID=UPI003F47BD8A
MTYSIIGAGNVGTALARQFARSGIAVSIANTRGVDSLAELANELGSHVTPVALEDALKAEVIILALPFRAHASVAAALPDWSGKVVVDAMNTYGISPDELKGQASSHVVAAAFAGADVVKTFNQLPAKLLAMNPAAQGGRRFASRLGCHRKAGGRPRLCCSGVGKDRRRRSAARHGRPVDSAEPGQVLSKARANPAARRPIGPCARHPAVWTVRDARANQCLVCPLPHRRGQPARVTMEQCTTGVQAAVFIG